MREGWNDIQGVGGLGIEQVPGGVGDGGGGCADGWGGTSLR